LQNTDVTSKGESINVPIINIIRGKDVKEIWLKSILSHQKSKD
jgi:hypothetical protein